jgi:outer membrane lipoprotein-sorting protein
MLKKIIFAMSLMILSAFAGDSFLNSCQKKWNATLANMKSFRGDMVQTMSLEENNLSNSQDMKIMYLKLDQTYLRMDVQMNNVNSFVICRGDSMYVKTGDDKWLPGHQKCSSNPLLGAVEALGKSKLKFVKESNGSRIYQDSLKVNYKIQTKTCRIVEAENADMKTSWEYEIIKDLDIPVKNTMNVKKNSAKIEVEFKNLLVNQGVTKSFFEVK